MGLDRLDQNQDRVANPSSAIVAALGAWLIVFGSRSGEILLHAGTSPFFDQWKVAGLEVVQPWLNGSLHWFDFFQPHHEHVPVWTRLITWIEVAVTNRWDPILQCSVNAAIHGGFVAVVVYVLFKSLSPLLSSATSVFAATVSSLPHAWENITWGFQSQFPVALLCLALYVTAIFKSSSGRCYWWMGLIFGIGGLLTLGGMAVAPLSVLMVALWTKPLHWSKRDWIAHGMIALIGFLLFLWARASQPPTGAAELHAHDLKDFLDSLFNQLGWPAGSILLQMPLAVMFIRRFRNRHTTAYERIFMALGLWSVGQATAIAMARSGDYTGYVSRYTDLLQLGLVANLFCGVRLLTEHPTRWWRWTVALLCCGWVVLVGCGLHTTNTTGHTAYFHNHSYSQNEARRNLITSTPRALDNAAWNSAVRQLLYPEPEIVSSLIADAKFSSLLVPKSGPSRIGVHVRTVVRNWTIVLGIGVALFLVGSIHSVTAGAHATQPKEVRANHAIKLNWPLAGAALCLAGLFLWRSPFVFNPITRKSDILNTAGTISHLSFTFSESSPYPPSRLEGAARIDPGEIRNQFFGTHITDGKDRTTIVSGAFPITAPRLVIPFAGDTADENITLAIEFLSDAGSPVASTTCNIKPSADVGFWEIDTTPHQGQSARLILRDASSADTGWVAVAPPQMTPVAGMAHYRSTLWLDEDSIQAHRTLALLGSILSAWALVAWISSRGKGLRSTNNRHLVTHQ
ncbi:MAG: hypothetical protein R3F03_09535 [Opitutaceae bacterium]